MIAFKAVTELKKQERERGRASAGEGKEKEKGGLPYAQPRTEAKLRE